MAEYDYVIVGAGSASGSLDAANMLKPALARGELRCIGATTPAEFKQEIEKDTMILVTDVVQKVLGKTLKPAEKQNLTQNALNEMSKTVLVK